MTTASEAKEHLVEYLADPSARTTASIEREVSTITRDLHDMRESLQRDLDNRAAVRMREQEQQEKIFNSKLEAIQKEFETKIVSIDNATALRLQAIRDMPANIDKAVGHHEDLQKERFRSIQQQFRERDIRTDQASRAGSEALAAALQAAKELVGAQGEASAAAAVKSETSFTKQIDQIGTIISTLEKALDGRITELKERIDRGEGNTTGQDKANNDAQDKANALLLAAVNEGNAKKNSQSNQIALVGVALIILTVLMPIVNDMITKLP